MTAPNHAITGAIIGLVVGNPVVAIPLAIMSHVICDIIPHYSPSSNEEILKTKTFKYFLVIQAVLCFILVLGIYLIKPDNYLNAIACAFFAAAPDFLWIKKFIKANTNKRYKPTFIEYILGKIQWFQRPIGGIVEIAWALASFIIILPLLS